MTITHKFLAATMMLVASVASASAFAEDYSHSTPGISGYDPVSYFADGKAVRGSGFHVTVVDGVPYAFATAEHQKLFEAPPPELSAGLWGLLRLGSWCRKEIRGGP